ncbi:MAG: transcription elongation factor GreA [Clostridia bacterium]|jgi:transcription elongation factor GreA|nr:transcription elongation factor GreA [Clostridia bacterium]MEE1124586.1 transcription elongation factor GreA [Acutalibacteraceae bacterium]
MQKEVRLTKEGLENLQKELDFLKTTKRDEIAEKIEIARSYGDLSENAEYDEAKNDQAVVEARIAEIDNMLKNAVVIEDVDTGKVRPGATVVVKNLKMNKEFTYKIVGSNEADPLHGLLSDESPVGSALMDKAPGEVVSVETPAGVIEYEIVEILKKTGEN